MDIDDCSLVPPSDEEILSWELMGTHEAAFWITDWPREKEEPYYPDPTQTFKKWKYGVKFEAALRDIEKAIEEGKLYAKTSRAVKGVVLYVKPEDVLVWALRKGHLLPERLQKALKLYQFTEEPRNKNILKAMIIFQLIFVENPEFDRLDQFLDHPLVKEILGDHYTDQNEQKALKRHLEAAIGFKASRGENTSKQPLFLKEISHIIRKEKGRTLYNVPALAILIHIVCRIIILSKKADNIGIQNLFKEVMRNPIVELHMKDAPEMLLKVLWKICIEYIPHEVVYL